MTQVYRGGSWYVLDTLGISVAYVQHFTWLSASTDSWN